MKGLARDRKITYAYPIKCSKCGCSGGTMVKEWEGSTKYWYEHQDKEKCRIMQFRTKGGE